MSFQVGERVVYVGAGPVAGVEVTKDWPFSIVISPAFVEPGDDEDEKVMWVTQFYNNDYSRKPDVSLELVGDFMLDPRVSQFLAERTEPVTSWNTDAEGSS